MILLRQNVVLPLPTEKTPGEKGAWGKWEYLNEGNIISKRGVTIKRTVKNNSESSAPGVLPIKNKISFIDFKPQLTPDENLPDLTLPLTLLNNE